MIRKSISIIMALVMLLSLLPISALAEENRFTGQPPVIWGITGEDAEPFRVTGAAYAARSSEYSNAAPDWVDTVEEKVTWIAEQCRAAGNTEEWDIALWLHNWLIYNANYDYTFTYYYEDGVLLLGTGVCNSYALAYGLLLDEFGIENIKLDAPEMDHAWNLVKIEGEWCHVDCTWDDPGTGGYENHTYFGLDDELMGRDHIWDTSAYPACTSRKNCYLIRTGKNIVTGKEEMMSLLSQLALDRVETIECYYLGTDMSFSLIEVFQEWFNANYAAYGIWGCGGSYNEMWIEMNLTYDPNWDSNEDLHIHSYTKTVVPPTCTSQGYTSYYCAGCGDNYQDSITAVVDHSWEDDVCTVCGTTACESGHTYVSQYDYKCDVCGQERTVDMTRPMVDMYRMYNPNTGEHFYTGSTEERENLLVEGWQYEGVGFTFPLTTGAPVYRLFDPATGEHLYTMDEYEKEYLMAWNWNYEGIAFNSGFENEVPQYRLHNPNATVGAYHFTASTVERDTLLAAGWEYQGIGWYSLGA